MTFRPMFWNRSASFPIVVVLPTPFTPTTSITIGHFSGGRGMSICSTMICFRISRASPASFTLLAFTRSRSSSTISVVAFRPQSAMSRISSNSS